MTLNNFNVPALWKIKFIEHIKHFLIPPEFFIGFRFVKIFSSG
jgi:hypothetical protein